MDKEAEQAQQLYPGPTEFAHLHAHTIFSPLDGVITPEQLFSRCKEYDMPAIAITDHGQLAAFPDAYFASKEYNVKFIPACEIYFNDYHLELKEFQANGGKINELRLTDEDRYKRYRRNRHLTVLTKNMDGYRNLIKMTTDAWELGCYYDKPRIWLDCLDKHREGLIILSGCLNGPICHEFREAAEYLKKKDEAANSVEIEQYERAAKNAAKHSHYYASKFSEIFGDNFFFEAQMPGPEIPYEKMAFKNIAKYSKKFNRPCVLTNDVHYLERRDFYLQKVMMAISQGVTVDSDNLFHVNSDHQFLKTRAQLRQTFYEGEYDKLATSDEFEEFCDNSVMVADMCDSFDPDLSPKLPKIENAEQVLRQEVEKGLKEKGLWDSDKKYEIDGKMVTHREQAEIELKRFIEKGFAAYFLITKDLIDYSKSKGWPIGPARGCSKPGSKILTTSGNVNIEDIEVGDMVYDSTGTLRPVSNKYKYIVNEDLINISTESIDISVTCDHKLYVVREGVVILCKACDIKDTDKLLISQGLVSEETN